MMFTFERHLPVTSDEVRPRHSHLERGFGSMRRHCSLCTAERDALLRLQPEYALSFRSPYLLQTDSYKRPSLVSSNTPEVKIRKMSVRVFLKKTDTYTTYIL